MSLPEYSFIKEKWLPCRCCRWKRAWGGADRSWHYCNWCQLIMYKTARPWLLRCDPIIDNTAHIPQPPSLPDKIRAIRHPKCQVSLFLGEREIRQCAPGCVLFLVCDRKKCKRSSVMYGQPSCYLSSLSETWVPGWMGATGWMGSLLQLGYWFLCPAGLALLSCLPQPIITSSCYQWKRGGWEAKTVIQKIVFQLWCLSALGYDVEPVIEGNLYSKHVQIKKRVSMW